MKSTELTIPIERGEEAMVDISINWEICWK